MGGHAIESLSFEVAFGSEAEAHACQDRLGDFMRGRGLAAISDVFDEFSGADEVVRLDRLEIDLGEAGLPGDESTAEQRLREAVRRALSEALLPRAAAQREPKVVATRADRARSELDLVWAHLHDGRLPWPAAEASAGAFDALVTRVVARRRDELTARLKASAVRSQLVARMVRQWPVGALAQLAGHLGGADAGASRAAATRLADARAPKDRAEELDRLLQGPASGDASDAKGVWPVLLDGEPEVVRSRLRHQHADPARRAALAAAMGEAEWRRLLALWVAPADVTFLAALVSTPEAWRLGAAAAARDIAAVLGGAMLDHLFAEGRDGLKTDTGVEILVRARAGLDGLAPARIARGILAAWRETGADEALEPRLQATLAGTLDEYEPRPAPSDAAKPTELGRWRLEADAALGQARLAEEPWRILRALEPSWLAARLRHHGRTAAWRRAFARDLSPERVAEVIGLWIGPADAAFLSALVNTAEPWLLGASRSAVAMAAQLRASLLDELLLAAPGSLRADAIVHGLIGRRATYDDLDPAQAPRDLVSAWPGQGPAASLRSRLQQVLDVPGEPDGPPQPSPTTLSADRDTLRARLQAAFVQARLHGVEPLLRHALAEDRAWLLETMGRQGADPRLRRALVDTLPPALIFELAQPWLSEAEARVILAAATSAPAPPWEAVLAAIWDKARPSDPEAAARRLMRLLRVASEAQGGQTELSETVDKAPLPTVAALLGWLPGRTTAAVGRALAALLTPADEGWRQIQGLSEVRRRELLRLLRGEDGQAALRSVDTLAALARAGGLPEPSEGAATFTWRFLLTELLEEGRRFEPRGFAERWIAARVAEAPVGSRTAWRDALTGGREALAAGEPAVPESHEVATSPTAWPMAGPAPGEALHVANAGLVLAAPYIPLLFSRLELTLDGEFTGEDAAERAVHLLQFLVDGGRAAPEHQLVLNKLLCGLDLATPIGRAFEVRDPERETIESLLAAMIERWTILGNTSIAGLRESFLQRQGALTVGDDDAWRLLVEPRSFDMLLDQIPWGFSTLKLPWMAQVVHVDWR